MYTRSREHVQKYRSKKGGQDSFMKKHQDEKHNRREADFNARVTGVFVDSLSRQVSEGVNIRRGDRVYSIQKVSGTSLHFGGFKANL